MTPTPGTHPFESFLGQVGASSPSAVSYAEYLVALALGFVLSMLIAFVYQRTYRGRRYQQDFVHTLVIMGVVVAVVMMVVGDNMARAFGIFAAFSMIRFRRNLPEARDLGFLFFALVVGLTTGAREYVFAVMTTVLVCLTIVLISRFDLFAPPRSGFTLRIRVPMDLDHQAAFADVFDRMLEAFTLVATDTVSGERQLELRYELQLRQGISPGDLVAELYGRNEGLKIQVQSAKGH